MTDWSIRETRVDLCFVYAAVFSCATYNLFLNKASLLVVKSDHTPKENTETVNIEFVFGWLVPALFPRW